jgi:soluble lytic murein transglycosylase-like protein
MRAVTVGLLTILGTTMLAGGASAQVPQMVDGAWQLPTQSHHAAPAGSAGGYEQAIYDACARYGCDGSWLVSVMYCESGGDPNAVGVHGEIGIFQFMPDTFYSHGGSDIWNPYDQIEVAAEMFAAGLSYHWLCA